MNYGDDFDLPGLTASQPLPDQNQFLDFLRRLQVSGGISTMQQPNVNVTAGGGRIGYAMPVAQGDLSVGASGNMSKVNINAPDFNKTIRERQLTGVDAAYRQGPNTYGIEWGRGDPMASNMQQINQLAGPAPNMVPQEFLRLFLRKQF